MSSVIELPLPTPPVHSEEAEGKGEDGISAEDREEILSAIADLSSGNRISGNRDGMVLHPRRKGFVFPLVINVIAAALTLGGLFGLSAIFSRRQERIEEGRVLVATAEGKLIQEIRRDSESKLREKDKAIADIQVRLSSIDQQRDALAASLEDRIKAKEAEFKAELQTAIDRERKRLLALGLSEVAIQERLKQFEAEKNAEFERELAAYRKRADQENAAKEAELASLRDEYQKTISGLGEERAKILNEASQKEAALRSSLETKARELESRTVHAEAGMEQAKAELSRLQNERAGEQSAEDRIVGLYDSIRTALRDRRFEAAAAGASTLGSYLNEPSVIAMPALQGRREADLFIADTLGGLARGELERESENASVLLRQSELIASIKSGVAEARKALIAGDQAAAEARYQEALAAIPEILAAHTYFITKARGEDASNLAKLDAAEQKDADDAKALAEERSSSRASLARADRLQAELETVKTETAKAASAEKSTSVAAAGAAQAGDIDALKKEVALLKSQVSAYDDSLGAYSAYVSAEDKARQESGAGAEVAAKASLDVFLDNPAIQKTFPRMNERIGRLLLDYRKDIPSETLLSAAEIAVEASKFATAEERQNYLDEQSARYATANPELGDFIEKFKSMQ